MRWTTWKHRALCAVIHAIGAPFAVLIFVVLPLLWKRPGGYQTGRPLSAMRPATQHMPMCQQLQDRMSGDELRFGIEPAIGSHARLTPS